MILSDTPAYSLFFGDSSLAIDPDQFRGATWQHLQFQKPFSEIKELLSLETLVLQHQVHGIDGALITHADNAYPFLVKDGDYLITTVPHLGIGVITADCLPIIITAGCAQVIAVVHAGWRGLIGGIVSVVLNRLHTEQAIPFSDFKLTVGPGAGVCCYQVGRDFLESHHDQKMVIEACIEKDNQWKFDSKLFLKNSCIQNGLSSEQVDFSHNLCTICEPLYCSYRREKKSPLRQLTVVSLK